MKEESRRELNKFLANVLILSLALGCEVLGFMKGWGLRPVNWGWIVGAGFFGSLILRTLASMMDEK